MVAHFYRQKRIVLLLFLVGIAFLLLGYKLFKIQIVQGPELSRGAVRQRALGITLMDGRGDIQDRHGRSLLDSSRQIGLVAFPTQYRGREEELAAFLSALESPERAVVNENNTLPFWLVKEVNEAAVTAQTLPPGVMLVERAVRYGANNLAAHLTGYMRAGEGRGVSGIELAFNEELSRGQEKVLAVLVDGRGKQVPGLGYRLRHSGRSGDNVLLTLDRDLQREVERIMDMFIARGAVVVMDPRQGDILAMAGRPVFHPGRPEEYLDDEGVFLNRALWEYQPGSIFKTLIAAAALEEGKTTLTRDFTCPGGMEVDGLFIPCSQLHPHRDLNLVEAFAFSCNSVFVQLAVELGGETVHRYAETFGLGKATGLPVGERSGCLPTVEEMAWSRNLANLAIGQGDLLVTPLQTAQMMAVFANGGTLVEPRLVLALTDAFGRLSRRFPVHKGRRRVLGASAVNRLKYLMQEVVSQGTGKAAAVTKELSGAKTGTAQSGRLWEGGGEILNYWIAGFYPLENPRAVVVVFADEMKEGSVSEVFGEIALYLEEESS